MTKPWLWVIEQSYGSGDWYIYDANTFKLVALNNIEKFRKAEQEGCNYRLVKYIREPQP